MIVFLHHKLSVIHAYYLLALFCINEHISTSLSYWNINFNKIFHNKYLRKKAKQQMLNIIS